MCLTDAIIEQMTLPDFKKNSSVLIIIAYTQVITTVLYMLGLDHSHQTLERYGYMSMYGQWLSISTATCLSVFRNKLNLMPNKLSFSYTLLIFSLCFLLTESVFRTISWLYVNDHHQHLESIFRYLGCLTIFLIILRIIELLNTIEARGQSHADATLSALQARIKPHFLFNSLNTIAELTHADRDQAEHAINSLATLFRASLSTDEKQHSLEEELNLCYRYEDLERWRLNERLNVDWNVDVINANAINVPKLILQPILENSISHGVEADGKINIELDIRESSNVISMMITNGINRKLPPKHGNGMAIANIKERLFVMYDDQFKFKLKDQRDRYSVFIQIPKLKK